MVKNPVDSSKGLPVIEFGVIQINQIDVLDKMNLGIDSLGGWSVDELDKTNSRINELEKYMKDLFVFDKSTGMLKLNLILIFLYPLRPQPLKHRLSLKNLNPVWA